MIGPLIGDDRRLSLAARGWTRTHKWWLLRRASQITAMTLFMAGPWAGLWLVQGNFAASDLAGVVPLADPYIALQSFFAGRQLAAPAIIGAALIVLFYLVVGGRAYCGWICPVNVVTDTAHWLREKTGLTRDRKLDRRARLVILVATLGASALTGTIAWEFVNPVSLMQRGLISGIGFGWSIVLGVFLLDLLVSRRAWCSHLCPVGAFYGQIGRLSLIRVGAAQRLHRLRRLFPHLPRTAYHRRTAARHGQSGHPLGRLPELRRVYRRLPRGCLCHDRGTPANIALVVSPGG